MSFTVSNEAELIAEAMAAIFERLHLWGLGSGPNPWATVSPASGSGPNPWRTSSPAIGGGPNAWMAHSPAVSLFVSGVGLRQVASNLPEGQTKQELLGAVGRAIEDWEIDYCGTPPHPISSLALASSLAAFAGNLEEGALRAGVQQVAAQIAGRAFGTANLSATETKQEKRAA